MQAEEHTFLKNILLERYFSEPIKVVRGNIAVVIGNLAAALLPKGEWNELLVCVSQKTAVGQPDDARVVGLRLLAIIIDVAGENLEHHYMDLKTFFQNNLNDANPEVDFRLSFLFIT
jgi:hypothetical protein